MKILFDIGHPAHVHLFKNVIRKLQEKNHEVIITARAKEITIELLELYGFDYFEIGKNRKGIIGKSFGILKVNYRLYKIAKQFKPDLLVGGTGDLYAAHVSKIIGKSSIIFDDTEHAFVEHSLCDPFSTIICTPSAFKKNLGQKHIRYNGYKELAYLHPNYFSQDSSILDYIGLEKDEKFCIIRFVAWSAIHDRGHHGISNAMKIVFINELSKFCRVLITSEDALPAEFENYRLKIPIEKFHSLLSYAQLYIGEGGSSASEAAILGTPSIFISTTAKYCGVFDDLLKYDLLYLYDNDHKALEKAISILGNPESKKIWMFRRDKMLKEKIDVTKFMIELIEDSGNNFSSFKVGN